MCLLLLAGPGLRLQLYGEDVEVWMEKLGKKDEEANDDAITEEDEEE